MAVLTVERIERPASLFGPAPGTARGAADAQRSGRGAGLGGGLTLDEAILEAWEGLTARVAVACPVCAGELRPRAGGEDAGGRCGDCGTTLD